MSLVTIGASKPPADALEALLECHARIRHFVSLSGHLAESQGDPADQVAEVAASIHRYLTEALPLHAADEDDSLLPRLQGKARRIDAELERMRTDHEQHGAVLDPIIKHCLHLASHPDQVGQLGPRLGIAAVNLASHFAGHLRREEEVIFPFARRVLTPEELAAVWAEMRARRAEPPPAG